MKRYIKTFEEFCQSIHKKREEKLNEIADWDTRKIKKDRDTVSCDDDEMYERNPIKDSIKEDNPGLFTDKEIDDAINACCKKAGQSRIRDKFYQCVYDNLTKA